MVFRRSTVRKVYVRYFVLVTGNMAAEFAIAKKVGKGQNAMFLKEIVALPTVPVMENASEDSASASLDGKGKDAKKSIVKIPIALNMELALMDNAIVKLDGKGLIATLSTSKFTNVCHHVLNTEYTIWNLLNVSAIDIGLDQIARNHYAT